MKEHFCSAEKSIITYQGKCNWCGEQETLAQTQEPVAWIHNFIDGGISIGKRPADLNRHPDRWTALYKDPTPCQTCEALSRTVMLDQTSHDTTPQPRTWVGLTDDELTEAWHWGGCDPHIEGAHFKALYQYFEAKLKDKNHVAQETN